MSTNKTQNFGLHAWESGDLFLRSEFNENFAALDEAAWIVTGTYVGDDAAERVIELGFAPRAVLLMKNDGSMEGYQKCGGLALSGAPVMYKSSPADSIVSLNDRGFTVYKKSISSSHTVYTNNDGTTFHYLALR